MGIDVWVLRTNVAPIEAETAAAAPAATTQSRGIQQVADAIGPITETQTDAPKPAPKPAAPQKLKETPSFTLALFHYGTVGICISVAPGQSPPRKFCDDVARAAGGDVGGVRYQQLEWPMVKSSSIDQSIDAARAVVAQKFSLLPQQVMIFGSDVCNYFAPIEAGSPGTTIRHEERRFTLMPAVAEVMSSASHKRQLWQLICQEVAE